MIRSLKRSIVEKDYKILCLRNKNAASRHKFDSFFQSGFQSMAWKFLGSDEFRRVQVELLTLAVNVGFELVEATPLVATVGYPYPDKVANHSDRPLSTLTSLELDRMACLVPAPTPRVVVVSLPYSKELTVTPASPNRELVSNDITSSSKAAESEQHPKEQYEEWADVALAQESELTLYHAHSSVVVALTAEKEGEDAPSTSQHVSSAPIDIPASSKNDPTSYEA
ncbi:hypothetical protein Tco_0576917 [Tanacetum coccineum]